MTLATPSALPVPQKAVTLYFIGLHHMGTRPPIFFVKGRAYPAPTTIDPVTQKPVLLIGGAVQVSENDVAELLTKTKANLKGLGVVDAFTTDPNIANAVRKKAAAGDMTPVSASLSLAEATSLLTPEDIKARVADSMTVEDLERMLAQKRNDPTPTPPPLVPNLEIGDVRPKK